MRKLLWVIVILLVVVIGGLLIWKAIEDKHPRPGTVKDEALAAGRNAASMPPADEDYFRDMDKGITKDPEAVRAALDPYIHNISAPDAVKAVVRGRNNWIVWTAGNDRLWDTLSVRSLGNLDLLKTISNHPSLKFSRDNRWQYLGLVNEPCYKKNTQPRADRYDLVLDVRDETCPPDPFENEQKYPGVKTGARGENGFPVGSYYGYGTGIVGLRLFPNPAFDEKAQKRWSAKRYYEDATYYNDARLVKPYRVGMSCGFCHVGPDPTNPPEHPEHPKWENLNSNPGAQYFWIDRIFMWNADSTSFVYQLFHTSRPGALDTSLVSSDQINNPRTMNAVYNLAARLEISKKWGQEKLAGGALDNKQLNDYVPAGTPLAQFYQKPDTVWTPHVLKDGSDSVGALGALNRVYLNIGLFSEEWLLHFIPLVGGADITPIPIATARKNSTYWNANETQTPDLALFFLATAKPDYLRDARGGAAFLPTDEAQLTLGKTVFADRCARCHSSKLPAKAFTNFFPPGSIGPDYLEHWNDYWQWSKTPEFKDEMKKIVLDPDFLKNNFLSTDLRVPSTLLQTNQCSPLATNAIGGDIWDNFSSQSYKDLPSVGKVSVQHPFTGEVSQYEMPGGGRGYTRPPSLVSVWSTAPFLLNNSLGKFEWSGSVAGRVQSFDDSIRKLLWPEKREGDFEVVTASGKRHPGQIDRTYNSTYLYVAEGYVPKSLRPLRGITSWIFPNALTDGGLQFGPIPKGTPINLLSNIDLKKKEEVLKLGLSIIHDLKKIPKGATDEEAARVFAPLVPKLLAVSKCPDFVVNKGHYFGTGFLGEEPGLSDPEKEALIAFLKTF